jgi:hypothetical protein
MTGEGFRRRDDPETLTMRRDEELACSSVRQFITLQLPSDMGGILSTEVDRVGIATTVRPLDDDTLWKKSNEKQPRIFLIETNSGRTTSGNAGGKHQPESPLTSGLMLKVVNFFLPFP